MCDYIFSIIIYIMISIRDNVWPLDHITIIIGFNYVIYKLGLITNFYIYLIDERLKEKKLQVYNHYIMYNRVSIFIYM